MRVVAEEYMQYPAAVSSLPERRTLVRHLLRISSAPSPSKTEHSPAE